METRVASIHFDTLTASRRYRGQAYVIPPAKLGADPNIIVTRDLIETDEGPWLGATKRQKIQNVVKGEEIARCIVGQWDGSTVPGTGTNPMRHPGVWVVRERMPVTEKQQKIVDGENLTYEERMVLDASGANVFRPATDEERRAMWEEDLAHARAADRAYAEWCWSEGNRIWLAWQRGSKEPVPREIPPTYKKAAIQYGLDAEWLKEAASSNAQACPTCEKLVSRTALICQFCSEPIDIERWAKWKAQKERALASVMSEFDGKKGKVPLQAPIQVPAHTPAHAGV